MSDWVCNHCRSVNRDAANSCYSCGGVRELMTAPESRPHAPVAGPSSALPAGDAPALVPNMGGALLARSVSANGTAGEAEVIQRAGPADLLGGLLGGLVAAILATAVWYGVVAVSGFQVGIVAIAVGFLVGQGVVIGARRHGSVLLVALSAALTLLALVVAEYLILAHFAGQQLAAEGLAIEVVQPPDFVISVVTESVQSDPLTLVFWAIALFQAVAIPWRLLGRRAD